jgi:flagellar hook assembly protein FlgD
MSDRVGGYSSTSSIHNGIEVSTPYDDDKQGVKVEDFLQLMIAQLTNQDFLDPVDDTQYITQLAQFATMQSMQELSHYSQTSYVASLVGKNVTVASLGFGGSVTRETGLVAAVNLNGDEYTITVNGKTYKLSQVMSIDSATTEVTKNELENASKMALYTTDVGRDSVTVRWDAPISDDRAEGLIYDVYYTTDGQVDFSDINNVKKGELAGEGLAKREFTLDGLEPGKTYFINVVVRSADGTSAAYRHTTQATA